MATITASIERSLQNCSLNQTTRSRARSGGVAAVSKSSSSDSNPNPSSNYQRRYSNHDSVTHHESNASSSDDNSTFVELNSHVSLPYHWEQCLDLKTGEIYYINWSNGMKCKEDPRTTATTNTGYNGDYYSEEEDEEDNEYDSEGSTTERCPPSWRNLRSANKLGVGGSGGSWHNQYQYQYNKKEEDSSSVLVVAGCKSCLMYYMVEKQGMECPKCCGQLFHFPANHPNPNSNSSP